jgi:predicted transcriptional regulator
MWLLHITFIRYYTLIIDMRDNILEEATNILGILSKQDALKIFLTCVEGIEADTDAAERLGLTKKQYYTRLKQLVDYGLIEKRHGKYVHTTLGKTIHDKTLRMLFEHVRNSKKLMMLDILKSSGKFDVDEIYRLLQIKGEESKVRLYMDYDTLIADLAQRMSEAKSSVVYATRHFNEIVIGKSIELHRKGVSVRILADRTLVDKYMAEYGISTTSGHKEERFKMFMDPFYPDKLDRRIVDVPFSFVVIDDKYVGLELINSYNPSRFYAGIYIEDEHLAMQMKSLFDALYANVDTKISR